MIDFYGEIVAPTSLTENEIEEQKTFEAAWALEEGCGDENHEDWEPQYCPECSGTGYREELLSRCPDCSDGYLDF